MFRIIVLKFPYNGFSLVSRSNPFRRFHLTSRHYQKHGSEKSKGGSVIRYTFGTLAVGTVATIAYAAYDPGFRKWMGRNVPYTDEFFKTVFQEEVSFIEQLEQLYTSIKTSTYSTIFGESEKKLEIHSKLTEKEQKTKEKEDYKLSSTKAPPPVFPDVAEKDESPEKPWKEVHVQPKGDIPKTEIDKPEAKEDPAKLAETYSKKLTDLEAKIASSASEAISVYEEAANTLNDYSSLVFQFIENSVSQTDKSSWKRIKEAGARKDEVLQNVEAKSKDAMQSIGKLKILLASELNIPIDVKEKAKRNLNNIVTSIKEAQQKLDIQKKKTSVTEKYWEKVKSSREYFEQELEVLFPTIKLEEKQIHIDPSEFDLFILYAYQTVCYYQKELKKLEILGDERLKRAVLQSSPDDDSNVIQAKIEAEIEKKRRELELDFQRKVLQLRIDAEKELRNQLKRQAQAHSDHLSDVIKLKEQEMEREFTRVRNEKEVEEQANYKKQLAGMVGRLRGLDAALRARAENDIQSRQAQILWSACQTLHRSLKPYGPGVPGQLQLRPLNAEIENVSKAATPGDELVDAIVSGIPKEAVERGVFTEDAMRERFLKVEKVARRLALVPESGGKLPLYLLSILQSFLLVKANNPISASELADEPIDLDHLDTYDILERARYWMDRGNFSMTLRYMNLLKGASRAIAQQWMNETRILLETQQAANALMAHAAAAGLLYI